METKRFLIPECLVINFQREDIIVTSGGDEWDIGGAGEGDIPGTGN